MFENLKKHSKILVSGPQRSGTRICAEMIAVDIGHRYVDERQIDIRSVQAAKELIRTEDDFVLHCPALCRYVHLLAMEDCLVVMMKRDIGDIVSSQKRIKWDGRNAELHQYHLSVDSTLPIAVVKYYFWEHHQKSLLNNSLEVEYKDLSEHPLWVSSDKRQSWDAYQTQERTT